MRTSVLVAGGGPAGPAAAVELGRRGVRAATRSGCTTSAATTGAEHGQQVPQPVVEQVLREAVAELPSVTCLMGSAVTGVEQDARAAVEGPDGAGRVISADYLPGCDGAAGVGRTAIGASYTGSSGERPNLSVVFEAPDLAEKVALAPAVQYWVVSPSVSGLMGRLDQDDRWWAVIQRVDTRASAPDAPALVRSLIGPGDGVPVRVIATDPWIARMLLVDRYASGRVLLVGDAAHLNPPWGGHGFNTCVGDAVNIGWKLAAVLQGWGGTGLLDSYEPERRPVAARPGARLPHTWLPDGTSLYDRLGDGFTLLRLRPAGTAAFERSASFRSRATSRCAFSIACRNAATVRGCLFANSCVVT